MPEERGPVNWRQAQPARKPFMNEGPRCNDCGGCAVSCHDDDGWCRLCYVYCNGEWY